MRLRRQKFRNSHHMPGVHLAYGLVLRDAPWHVRLRGLRGIFIATRKHTHWFTFEGGFRVKLYVSGPMSWRRNHNHHAFHDAAKQLVANGFDVVDPAALDEGMDTTGWKHSDYLKRDIRHMLDCDGIAVLGNWQLSLGAEAEVALGKAFRWPVLTVEEWLYDFEPGGVTP